MTLQTPWGTQVITEVSSAAPDAEPVWVDISPYVSTDFDTWLGRATELVDGEPGHFQLPLINNDRRFTPGNPTSPYFPWFKQSRRLRMRELIAYTAFDLCDGYLEIPENVMDMDVTDGVTDGQAIMRLNVTGIDILGRLQNSRTFSSNLTEHILQAGGSTLVAYYPLTEPAAPFADATGNGYPSMTTGTSLAITGGARDASDTPGYVPASVPPPNGDSDSLLAVTMQASGGQDLGDMFLLADLAAAGMAVPLPAGQVATIVGWYAPDVSQAVVGAAEVLYTRFFQSGVFYTIAEAEYDASGTLGTGGVWAAGTLLGASLSGPLPSQRRWLPIAMRFGWSPNIVEFWYADRAAQVGTWTGSPANLSINQLYPVRDGYAGAVGHVQLYVGPASAWTHTDFLTQYQQGLTGLYGQTPGQRINTILDYAGFPAGRRDIDTGVASMQNVALTGTDPLTAMTEALDTERGRLYATGGRIVFRDRISLYNM